MTDVAVPARSGHRRPASRDRGEPRRTRSRSGSRRRCAAGGVDPVHPVAVIPAAVVAALVEDLGLADVDGRRDPRARRGRRDRPAPDLGVPRRRGRDRRGAQRRPRTSAATSSSPGRRSGRPSTARASLTLLARARGDARRRARAPRRPARAPTAARSSPRSTGALGSGGGLGVRYRPARPRSSAPRRTSTPGRSRRTTSGMTGAVARGDRLAGSRARGHRRLPPDVADALARGRSPRPRPVQRQPAAVALRLARRTRRHGRRARERGVQPHHRPRCRTPSLGCVAAGRRSTRSPPPGWPFAADARWATRRRPATPSLRWPPPRCTSHTGLPDRGRPRVAAALPRTEDPMPSPSPRRAGRLRARRAPPGRSQPRHPDRRPLRRRPRRGAAGLRAPRPARATPARWTASRCRSRPR